MLFSGLSGDSPDVLEKSNCPVAPQVTFFAKEAWSLHFPFAGWLTLLHSTELSKEALCFAEMWRADKGCQVFSEQLLIVCDFWQDVPSGRTGVDF